MNIYVVLMYTCMSDCLFIDVGFIFQDTEELKKEEGTQEYSPSNLLDATLEGKISLGSVLMGSVNKR